MPRPARPRRRARSLHARPTLAALLGAAPLALVAACASSPRMVGEHAGHAQSPAPAPSPAAQPAQPGDATIPADAATARARLDRSTRHGEWVMVKVPGADGRADGDSVRAWVVYPERATKAPVVLVVHEIFGLSTWVRGVADQLAADGFIAVAPDLLTGHQMRGPADSVDVQNAVAQISQLPAAEVQRRLAGLGAWGAALPAAQGGRWGIVGFCWGGQTSFAHAVTAPAGLGAAVVYYGASPKPAELASVRAPVLGLYGGNDARVNATIPAADSALRALGRTFVPVVYEGAGHGFLRQQGGQNGANLAASRQAWPRTVGWFRQHLGS